ncbi:protein ENHANCED DISEASE RESISTANCE 2-like [Salvia miltiorrhiza]|uniref:protein ENHANCED DISEASE RESISTANCE 2-like n=1 Tax=Salvia miltiorrhiza TaxID=226208 RepID=UPI0025ACD188|nr:protein ENHANCED DISEASE RESISTANCE 2-like [Salvia miltiorrhiza]
MCSSKHMQMHHNHQRSSTAASAMGDWREEAINRGSLKHVDLNTGSNGWAAPPGDHFSVRGPNYPTKKGKTPAGEWLLDPAGVDWIRSNGRLDNLLARRDNRVMNALRASKKSSETFIVAVNLQIPGREHHSVVFYFSSKEGEPISSNPLLNNFVNGSDEYRDSRFKIVNKIVKGPRILKTAVGRYSACLLGKAVSCCYHRGADYLEIDVDIGSSTVASAILRLALGCVKAVTVDLGFLVEGQTEEELPEKLFGAVRICQMEMSSAMFVDVAAPTATSNKVFPVDSDEH